MTTKKIVLMVAAVLGALALIVVVFFAAIIGFTLYSVGNSEAAVKAKDFLRNSDKLKTEIGEVKDFGSIISASGRVSDNSGETTLKLKVIGERKTVNASVELVYTNGSAWRVSAASYMNAAGQTINLLDPYESKLLAPLLIA
jgi:cytochrome oxidase complex assembly protein 1